MSAPYSILIADDEPRNVEILKLKLESEGFAIETAFDGESALIKFESQCPNMVLLDVMMPGIDGKQLCAMIKARSQGFFVPALLITALTTEESMVQGFEAGADDYLKKPINFQELIARIKNLQKIQNLMSKPRALPPEMKTHEHVKAPADGILKAFADRMEPGKKLLFQVRAGESNGYVCTDGDRFVYARGDGWSGPEALEKILLWQPDEIEVVTVNGVNSNLDRTFDEMLAWWMRQLDMWCTVQEKLPPAATFLVRNPTKPLPGGMKPSSVAMLGLFEGGLFLDEALRRGGEDVFSGLGLIVELYYAGFLLRKKTPVEYSPRQITGVVAAPVSLNAVELQGLQELQAEIHGLKSEAEKLQAEAIAATAAYERLQLELQSELAAAKTEQEKTNSLLVDANTIGEMFQADLLASQAAKEQLQSELANSNAQFEQLQFELSSVKVRQERSLAEGLTSKEESEQHLLEIAGLKKDLAQAQSKITELANSLSSSQTVREMLQAELEELKSLHAEELKAHSLKTSENLGTTQEAADVRDALARQSSEIERLAASLAEKERTVASLQAEVEQSQRGTSSVQLELENVRQELMAHTGAVGAERTFFEKRISDLQSELATHVDELKAVRAEGQARREEFEAVSRKAISLGQELLQLQETIDFAQRQMGEQLQTVQALQAYKKQLEEKLQQKEIELQSSPVRPAGEDELPAADDDLPADTNLVDTYEQAQREIERLEGDLMVALGEREEIQDESDRKELAAAVKLESLSARLAEAETLIKKAHDAFLTNDGLLKEQNLKLLRLEQENNRLRTSTATQDV